MFKCHCFSKDAVLFGVRLPGQIPFRKVVLCLVTFFLEGLWEMEQYAIFFYFSIPYSLSTGLLICSPAGCWGSIWESLCCVLERALALPQP